MLADCGRLATDRKRDLEVPRAHDRAMSEQAREVRNEGVPNRAQGLYYNKGLFSEAIVYHDEETIYFELKGKDSGVVRFPFEVIEALRKTKEPEAEGDGAAEGAS